MGAATTYKSLCGCGDGSGGPRRRWRWWFAGGSSIRCLCSVENLKIEHDMNGRKKETYEKCYSPRLASSAGRSSERFTILTCAGFETFQLPFLPEALKSLAAAAAAAAVVVVV